jgi:hypothetical protein
VCHLGCPAPRAGKPLARRWWPTERPWRLTLPLETAAGGELLLGLAVAPWLYKQPVAPTNRYRSSGPRTIVVQVVQGGSRLGAGAR